MGGGSNDQIKKVLSVCAFDDYISTQQKSLPTLEDIEYLSPRVIRVLGQNAGKFTLQGTNTYIVGTGSSRLIIDTGEGIPRWADLISSTLATSSITLSHIALTHEHADHTGGIPDLLRLYPHLATSIYKNSPTQGQQPIADGQTFSVEGATIRAIHTPGHSHDHMCFILEEENAMFTGDTLLGHGTTTAEELGGYMSSLRRMQSHDCAIGYPAHGTVITNLPAKMVGELGQKLGRERQILRALNEMKPGEKSMSVERLAKRMYGDGVAEDVRRLALEPLVDKVLRKLAEDGKVGFEIRGGAKQWFGLSLRAPRAPLLSFHSWP